MLIRVTWLSEKSFFAEGIYHAVTVCDEEVNRMFQLFEQKDIMCQLSSPPSKLTQRGKI